MLISLFYLKLVYKDFTTILRIFLAVQKVLCSEGEGGGYPKAYKSVLGGGVCGRERVRMFNF